MKLPKEIQRVMAAEAEAIRTAKANVSCNLLANQERLLRNTYKTVLQHLTMNTYYRMNNNL